MCAADDGLAAISSKLTDIVSFVCDVERSWILTLNAYPEIACFMSPAGSSLLINFGRVLGCSQHQERPEKVRQPGNGESQGALRVKNHSRCAGSS